MTRILASAAILVALVAGPAAFAAAKAPAPVKTPTKHEQCVSQWKAQKKHTQTRKSFLAACEKAA